MDKSSVLSAFAALGQETRLDVLRLLIAAGPDGVAAGDIALRMGVRQNTMSVHLSVLNQAGLVTAKREGRTVRYAADTDTMRGLLTYMMQDCCGGRPELCMPVSEAVSCRL